MASKLGRVVARHGRGRSGWVIDFGRTIGRSARSTRRARRVRPLARQEARSLGQSRRNALGVFRAFLRWLARMERIERVPVFPRVSVPDRAPTIISPRTQALILDEIPHERRGIFLALCHGIRPGGRPARSTS